MNKTLLLAALLALSGCFGGGGGRADPDDIDAGLDDLGLKATSTTGVLRGVVVDEAIKPLLGVAVGVRSGTTNRSATTNADGLFGLDGLEPGEYFITATRENFTTTQAGPVAVVAGESEPDAVRITMTALASTQPYADKLVYEAFVACSVTSPSVSFAACGTFDILGEIGQPNPTNNRFLVNYKAAQPPSWIQSEAIWDSTQPLGGELGLSITALGPPQVTANSTSGTSPIYITVNETDAARFNYGVNDTDITIRLFSSELTGTDVVPEEIAQGAYASSVYGPLNGTGVPKAYDDTVIANDPTCFAVCLAVNPFGNPDCVQYPVLFNACYGFGGAGVAVNQQVKVYTQIFYGYTPPPGWRFSEGDVPSPP
jgi:hypothetical protein